MTCHDTRQRSAAHLRFLPACSPDLNPIEQALAGIEHWRRDARKLSIAGIWRHLVPRYR